jgi:hypothetical protein
MDWEKIALKPLHEVIPIDEMDSISNFLIISNFG